MSRLLYGDDHVTVTLEGGGLVRFSRSREPYASLEALREQHLKLRGVLSALPPGKLFLLIDTRDAPARNDDPFENEIAGTFQVLLARFAAHAVLVKSAVGRLQAQRMERSRGNSGPAVFVNEAEAIEYLKIAAESASERPRR